MLLAGMTAESMEVNCTRNLHKILKNCNKSNGAISKAQFFRNVSFFLSSNHHNLVFMASTWSERSISCWNMHCGQCFILSHLLHNSSIKLNWCHSKQRFIPDANSVVKLRCRIQEHVIISSLISIHVGTCKTLQTEDRKVWYDVFMAH